jgi:hypothetical protein
LCQGDSYPSSYADAAEHYTGGAWTVASAAKVPQSTLYGLACSADGQCWAVGTTFNTPGSTPTHQDLIETNTGS